jgi:hypothetical protein
MLPVGSQQTERADKRYPGREIGQIGLGVIIAVLPFLAHMQTPLRDILIAIGSTLIATALPGLWEHRAARTPDAGIVPVARKTTDAATVEIVAKNRRIIDPLYRDLWRDAKHEVTNVAIAMQSALKNMASDEEHHTIKKVVTSPISVRLVFMSPESPLIGQRAIEDGVRPEDLKRDLLLSLALCVRVFDGLRAAYDLARSRGGLQLDETGALEVRITQACPHITVFRSDNTIIWGLYTSDRKGYDSPPLRATPTQDVLYQALSNHFEIIWARSNDERYGGWVLRYDFNGPALNEPLLRTFFGNEWRERADELFASR